LLTHLNGEPANIRREFISNVKGEGLGIELYKRLKPIQGDPDPNVRAEAVRACGEVLSELADKTPVSFRFDADGREISRTSALWAIERMLSFDLKPLSTPTGPSTR